MATARGRALSWGLAGTIASIAAIVVVQPWGQRWDFANFYDAGQRIAAGQAADLYDPASPIDGQAPLGAMQFWGTPASALLYVPLAALPPRTALTVFKLQNLAVLALALALLFWRYLLPLDTSRGENLDRRVAIYLGLCLLFQPFWTVFVVGGQTTPTAFLLLVIFLIGYVGGARWTPALCLSLVFLIKPAFVLMVMGPIFAGQVRFLVALGLLLLGEGGLSLAVLGPQVHGAFLDHVVGNLGFERLWLYNSSLAAFVRNFGLLWPDSQTPASAQLLIDGVVALLKVAIVVLIGWHTWRGAQRCPSEPGRRNLAVLMGILFFLFASEIVWEHYLMVMFIPATFVLARRAFFGRAALWLVGLALVTSAAQNIVIALTIDRVVAIDTTVEILAVGLYKAGPLLLMLVFLTRHAGSFVASQPRGLEASAIAGGRGPDLERR